MNWKKISIFCLIWIGLCTLRSSWTVEDTILASTLIPNLAQGYGVDFGFLPLGKDLAGPEALCFTRDIHGRVLPLHPIGMFMLAAPIQILLWASAWLSGMSINITEPQFLVTRLAIEKLSASFMVALSAMFLHGILRTFTGSALSLLFTSLYILGSSALSVLSQGLWPHTGINLIIIALLYSLTTSNSSMLRRNEWMFFIALGMLVAIRPTTIPLVGLLVWLYRDTERRPPLISLLFTLFALIPGIVWNIAIFEHFVGGYSQPKNNLFDLNPLGCAQRLLLILFSPHRGLLAFNPLLMCAPFYFAARHALPAHLRRILDGTVALVVCQLLTCATNPEWHGGYNFGPRYMLDVLAPSFLLAGVGLQYLLRRYHHAMPAFAAILAITSIALHLFGALGDRLPYEELRALHARLLIPPV